MAPVAPEYKILGVAFQKDTTEIAFCDFEKFLLFGLIQRFAWLTPFEFVDHTAASSNPVAIRQFLTYDEQNHELRDLCLRHECNYVLYGAFDTEIGPTGFLENIHIELRVFSLVRDNHLLKLHYDFNTFNSEHVKANMFLPSWKGLKNFLQWASTQIIGAIDPEHALNCWLKLQQFSLATHFNEYQQLANAHYINAHEELPTKFSILLNLIQENPDLFLPHYELGCLQKRMQNYAQALASMELAFKLMQHATKRQRAQCATEIGVAYALLQQIDDACVWWKRAIQEDNHFINPYMNLGLALEDLGRITEAEFFFKKAGEVDSKDNRICFNLARLYSKMELWDKAIYQYKHQVMLEPQNAWVYSNLANCYLQKGDIVEAKTYLTKTSNLDPDGEAGRCAHFILSGLQAAEV